MSIDGISSLGGMTGIEGLEQLRARMEETGGFGNRPDLASISKAAERMHELAQLAESDPEQFKAVTAEVAEKLTAIAEESTGMKAEMLSSIAGKFQEASETGSMEALRPDRPPMGNGQRPPMNGQMDVNMLTETLDFVDSTVYEALYETGEAAT